MEWLPAYAPKLDPVEDDRRFAACSRRSALGREQRIQPIQQSAHWLRQFCAFPNRSSAPTRPMVTAGRCCGPIGAGQCSVRLVIQHLELDSTQAKKIQDRGKKLKEEIDKRAKENC